MSHGPFAAPLEVVPLLVLEVDVAPELRLVLDVALEAVAVLVELALEPEPPFCKSTVPVVIGLVVCGVQLAVFPVTQYEYCEPAPVVTALPDVV
jgi:hypothetical protein